MKFKYLLAASVVSTASAMVAAPAAAQSTGSVDFDESVIIVSGARDTAVGGVDIPSTPKAKQVVDEELIRRQRPGQTVNDIINLVPGVSFQNNDPWGSSGGGFTIRGFDDSRISQTLDGLPLNDSGNYALYTNQQVDPEVLEQVNVNLGVTDVDSPTASAVGGTVNIRTREPADVFKITATATVGDIFASGNSASGRDRLYMRGFAMIDTGDITGFGTKAFASASLTRYNNPFNNYGVVEKQQYNGRIWQDIGDNGDFIAVAGHYNQNRNNFFGSVPLRNDPSFSAGSGFTNRFPFTKAERFYEINYPCTVDPATPGVADFDNNCGAEFDRRYNPSNTGNIRGSSRFTLADGLVLTVDPSYQYVKANGGGDEELLEQRCYIEADGDCGTTPNGTTGYTGFFDNTNVGRQYFYGRDLNGDGDTLDQITGHDPSQTRTHRYGVIANLSYEINDDHLVRLAYTWDRANHRQTGQTSIALNNGEIADVFPINDPLITADGFALNKRNRQSFAILHQVSGEYRGRFGDLTAVLGLRAPFFTRELDQRCYTLDSGGDLACFENQDPTDFVAGNPDAAAPIERTYKYDKLLPNIGFIYDFGSASVFGNYAKGLSVPGTDPLYASLFFANAAAAQPVPETTDSFDVGLRFQSGDIQAQLAGWYTKYQNRLAFAYDPVLDETIFRNLGEVDKYGLDGSISWAPTQDLLLYVFGSILESEIKENVQNGVDGAGNPVFLQTAGKRESGAPTWSLGARAQYRLGDFEFGAQVKHTGKRYVNDENLPRVPQGFIGETTIFPATVGGYTLVDLDIRWTFGETPWGDDVALQLNVTNLLDELYVGSFGGSLSATSVPFVQIGAPRAASLSLIFGY
jgi:iron complex outermembrane receptor protein